MNVERFGGWTGEFPCGVFPTEARTASEPELERIAARPGLSVWLPQQHLVLVPHQPMRYDLGGQGTPADPGIHWYFERAHGVRERGGVKA